MLAAASQLEMTDNSDDDNEGDGNVFQLLVVTVTNESVQLEQ